MCTSPAFLSVGVVADLTDARTYDMPPSTHVRNLYGCSVTAQILEDTASAMVRARLLVLCKLLEQVWVGWGGAFACTPALSACMLIFACQMCVLQVKSGLKDVGYVYVNSDDCWMSFNRSVDGSQVRIQFLALSV